MTTTDNDRVVYRKDYTPPTYWIDQVALEFDLDSENTLVTAKISLRRNTDQTSNKLELAGEHLELQSITIDGQPLTSDQYQVTDDQLIINELPDACLLETTVMVHPIANKSLSGLYQTSGNFCTQCEALGFRRITYFLDRPDVMAKYQVTLRANADVYPVLLSNGNRIAEKKLADGRTEVVWVDPFPKPSYLFALVAGNLLCHSGTFTTVSGREVQLEIWVEPQNIKSCEHALVSLQKSMKWDEEQYGREYDLDVYMIVAVNDFNMGAMENKGLNVFNSKYVLALPETATDDDYLGIEAVIAHEYFHNWTGNRVTCRDWFQLTLKEGLTVFRDQHFTADQTSESVKRIDDVKGLRAGQFLEDAGPMAHPIRPESYISMDNFYTSTVYRKGAEIIRIYHALLGSDGFRKGMDLYFERHDNSAVTCDDFRAAMADANDVNLDSLGRWYAQPGTPVLTVTENWNAEQQEYTLSFKQEYPPLPEDIPGAKDRTPVAIPIGIGLLDASGQDLPLLLKGEENSSSTVLLLEEADKEFTFTGLAEKPTASVLRNFSAPVRLQMKRSQEELAFLMAHDSDDFNRWDAGQTLASQLIVSLAGQSARGEELTFPTLFSEAFGKILADDSLDGSFKALALLLPGESTIGQEMEVIDPDAIHAAREFLRKGLAAEHKSALLALYETLAAAGPYQNDQVSINNRRLKSTVLAYLSTLGTDDTNTLLFNQFELSDNMTDAQAAFVLLADQDCLERETAITQFYDRWKDDALVLDKWFATQAISKRSDTIKQVQALSSHPDFTLLNPNRVRSLIGAFTQNQVHFHQASGAGYQLLADKIIEIDLNNPQLAARLVSAFNTYRRFDAARQTLMQAELKRIQSQSGLSKDVREILERALKF
ncbi:MAG: aminopeptidase N [Blastopirellula sp.]|nr:MAG: aminopeptidase N [Blastopirellula sp.]